MTVRRRARSSSDVANLEASHARPRTVTPGHHGPGDSNRMRQACKVGRDETTEIGLRCPTLT